MRDRESLMEVGVGDGKKWGDEERQDGECR